MVELAYNLESFNPAFTAVLLKVTELTSSLQIRAAHLHQQQQICRRLLRLEDADLYIVCLICLLQHNQRLAFVFLQTYG